MKLKALTMIAFALILTASVVQADVCEDGECVRSGTGTGTVTGIESERERGGSRITRITITLQDGREWVVIDGEHDDDLHDFQEELIRAKSEGDEVTIEVDNYHIWRFKRTSKP